MGSRQDREVVVDSARLFPIQGSYFVPFYAMSEQQDTESIIEDATFDFAMGDADSAISKLKGALEVVPDSFEAWHALAEILYSSEAYEPALEAAENAHDLKPEDLLVNTSLSRIWLELGDKEKAEHFGAQARMLGWKEQIQNPDAANEGISTP